MLVILWHYAHMLPCRVRNGTLSASEILHLTKYNERNIATTAANDRYFVFYCNIGTRVLFIARDNN